LGVLPWMFGAIAGRALWSVYLRLRAKLAEWLRGSFGKPPNRDRRHGVACLRLSEYLPKWGAVRGLGMVEQTGTVGGLDEIRIGKQFFCGIDVGADGKNKYRRRFSDV
jgi:hypothetical protein